jgi:hypothetical protein
LLGGKRYPAKFIRGLAYRLATGVELDPSRAFSSGDETARFFASLGFTTVRADADDGRAAPDAQPAVPPPATSADARVRRAEPQKRALADLLQRRFGTVEFEVRFAWLTVPGPDGMDAEVARIHGALQAMRGFTDFAVVDRALRCDSFVPSERLIIEYDERQHFTLPRARALELYPPDLILGFDRQEWIDTCRLVQATDAIPPHRDEQRAFYDSLRDILASRNGVRLFRLRAGSLDWTSPDAGARLAKMVSEHKGVSGPASKGRTRPAGGLAAGATIGKLALVSHDYNQPGSRDFYDYSDHFERIDRLCDEHGCDTILYALYTLDRRSIIRNHDALFSALSYVRTIILETGEPSTSSIDQVEIWLRGRDTPVLAK